jgi:hypothetical protein
VIAAPASVFFDARLLALGQDVELEVGSAELGVALLDAQPQPAEQRVRLVVVVELDDCLLVREVHIRIGVEKELRTLLERAQHELVHALLDYVLRELFVLGPAPCVLVLLLADADHVELIRQFVPGRLGAALLGRGGRHRSATLDIGAFAAVERLFLEEIEFWQLGVQVL